jgi:hypothetical protein
MFWAGVAFPQQSWRFLCRLGDIRNPKNYGERRHWGSATESTIIVTSGGPATKEAAAMVAAAS